LYTMTTMDTPKLPRHKFSRGILRPPVVSNDSCGTFAFCNASARLCRDTVPGTWFWTSRRRQRFFLKIFCSRSKFLGSRSRGKGGSNWIWRMLTLAAPMYLSRRSAASRISCSVKTCRVMVSGWRWGSRLAFFIRRECLYIYIYIYGFPFCGGSTLALRFFAWEAVTQHPSVPPARNAHLNRPDSLFEFRAPLSAFNYLLKFYPVCIMRKLGEKRATRIQAAQVALLLQPQTRTEVSPVTDLKPCPPPLHLEPATGKRSATSSVSEHIGKKTRLMPGSSPRQETMQWQSIIGSSLTVRDESPWGTFRKYYDCDLAGPVAVCVRSFGDRGAWAVRQYPIEDADKVLRILRSMRYRNLASVRECCRTPDILYTLSEFEPLVLDHIVACEAFPDEQELAAIMSQVCSSFPLTYLPDGQMADSVQFVEGCHISWPTVSTTHLWIVLVSSWISMGTLKSVR
jgi:hypothetical protein